MSACENIRVELPAYLAGESDDATRRAVEAHLASCGECRAVAAAIEETVAALRAAPLADSPPDLEERAFARVLDADSGEVAALVRTAPLEHVPPDDLERRSLVRAGVLAPVAGRGRAARALAGSGLIIALVSAGIAGMQWRTARDMEQQFGPPGEPLQQISLRGPSPFPPGAWARLSLVHYAHDNYGLVLEINDLPPCSPGTHYEVWLTGADRSVSLGTFRVPGKQIYNFSLGLDPSDFSRIEISREPSNGDEQRTGPTMWMAPLDV